MAKPQLHLTPPEATAAAIRQQAARLGVSTNAYLVLFLNEIAAGRLKLTAHFPAPTLAPAAPAALR